MSIISEQLLTSLSKGCLKTKLMGGDYYVPTTITVENGRLLFDFRYNADLLTEIKTAFEGRKYHGYLEGDGRKLWSAPISFRNLFQLEALQGKYGSDPYKHWIKHTDYTPTIRAYCKDKGIIPYEHQVDMVNCGLNFHWDIWAAEMGLGKTLAAMMLCEIAKLLGIVDPHYPLWVGPNSALVAARVEFRKWGCSIPFETMTDGGLRKLVKEWEDGITPVPNIVILDEASLYKTPQAQRTKSAQYIADLMRHHWGENCIIILMSGTPAPKTPADWWALCEIACPGFVREATIFAFRERLGHMEQQETVAGQTFNKLKVWKNSVDICRICGEVEDHKNHRALTTTEVVLGESQDIIHSFEPGINEVAKLKKRLEGLVSVYLKEDCLDLPAKRYELIEVEPSQEILNAAEMIVKTTARAADAYIKLRTLSDGFLYKEKGTGEYEDCPGCRGKGKVKEYFDKEQPEIYLTDQEIRMQEREGKHFNLGTRDVDCYTCGGSGRLEIMERIVQEVPCPKLDVLTMLLERHEECGRLNVYAGFTGSIDRIQSHCQHLGWTTVVVDGRGWRGFAADGTILTLTDDELLYAYQELRDEYPKMVFIGNPAAAGMGLTLTAAPSTFFYSNDHSPQNRQQAEDRGHRPSMDVVRGGWIIDCSHLPSDKRVLESLKASKDLQRESMTGLKELYGVA